MTSKKTLILAAVAAMSFGIGSAVAQESAGGVNAGPYETRALIRLNNVLMSNAATRHNEPQFGSSDSRSILNSPVLQGADGNGG